MTNTDDKRFKLTTASIKAKCLPPGPDERTASGKPRLERFYWDRELPGFVRQTSKSFVVQKDVKCRSVRVTIGRFPEWTADAARIVEMDSGGNPNQRKREEAVRADDCAPRSIESMEYEVGLYLADWLTRPIAEIPRNECATRHRRITDRHGPYSANRSMRFFRACYNTADKRMEQGPPRCPVVAVKFNKEKRRQEPIPW